MHRYHRLYQKHPERFRRPIYDASQIAQLAKQVGNPHILIGGSAGRTSLEELQNIIQSRFQSYHLSTIDIATLLDFPYIQSNIAQLPFANSAFDIFITHMLFDCIDNLVLQSALIEISRVLRPNGFFICTTSAIQHPEEMLLEQIKIPLHQIFYGYRYFPRYEEIYQRLFMSAELTLIKKLYHPRFQTITWVLQKN